MSPNGVVVFFRSSASSVSADDTGGWPEIFRYDFATKVIQCVSCNSAGPTVGGLRNSHWAISSDGNTVAYATSATLVPRDIDGTPSGALFTGTDVYEWHSGYVRLITGGETAQPDTILGASSQVYGVSPDGTDVFFTGAKVTGHESDALDNLYDARLGGGFQAPASPTPCTEDSCQGPLQPAPPLDNLASSNTAKPANPPASFAKRRHKHKRHHRKHRQKKHAKHRRTTKGAHR